jgi:hypothetical protein
MTTKRYQRNIILENVLAATDLVTSKAIVDIIFPHPVQPNGLTGLDNSVRAKLRIKIKGSVVNNTATFNPATFVTGTLYGATITIDGVPKAVSFLGEAVSNVYSLISILRNQIDPTSSSVDIFLENDGASSYIAIQSKFGGASHTISYTAGGAPPNDLQDALETGESFANYDPNTTGTTPGTDGSTYTGTIDVQAPVTVSANGIQVATYEQLRAKIASDIGANGVVTLLSDRIRITATTPAAYTAEYTAGGTDLVASAGATVGLIDGVAGAVELTVLENISLSNPSRDVLCTAVIQKSDGSQKIDIKVVYDKTTGKVYILPAGYTPVVGDRLIVTAY